MKKFLLVLVLLSVCFVSCDYNVSEVEETSNNSTNIEDIRNYLRNYLRNYSNWDKADFTFEEN